MQMIKSMFLALMAVVLLGSIGIAGDYDWTRDFNLRAQADPSGFRASLESRFHVGDANIQAVLGAVAGPADAYMCLRLGEMAHRPIGYVLERYRAERGQGWGVLAKSLGIKPGSAEFHALKQGHDLHGEGYGSKGSGKGKGKGKGGGNGGGKGKKSK
ncbi:conserved hypothetical protein [Desulfosarcina cetonica]|nr:conserved hypothetical protein [Desulfosarcina cetonica]